MVGVIGQWVNIVVSLEMVTILSVAHLSKDEDEPCSLHKLHQMGAYEIVIVATDIH